MPGIDISEDLFFNLTIYPGPTTALCETECICVIFFQSKTLNHMCHSVIGHLDWN